MISFDELWEKCEQFQQQYNGNESLKSVIDELLLKINLYKAVNNKEIPKEEADKMKIRILGEILLNISALSGKDNINIYDALYTALNFRMPKN